jgi:hypothetical protein
MNLKNVNHINKLRRLNIPLNKALIIGSGTLALLGLKPNDDLDLWVTKDAYNGMKNNKKLHPVKQHGRVFYVNEDQSVEASDSMPCTKGRVEDYLKRAIVIYGFHFKSVDDVIAWKKCMGRPKDLDHIKLLEKYKKNDVTENYLTALQLLK